MKKPISFATAHATVSTASADVMTATAGGAPPTSRPTTSSADASFAPYQRRGSEQSARSSHEMSSLDRRDQLSPNSGEGSGYTSFPSPSAWGRDIPHIYQGR
jgi:hypothetical protein